MQVGLGEILLDPSIKEIEVIRAGRKIKGQRGTKSGRVCFLDENGNYIATYSGDKFRIRSLKTLEKESLEKELENENNARIEHKNYYQQSIENVPTALTENGETRIPNKNLLYLPNYDENDEEIKSLKEITPSTGKQRPKSFINKHLPIAKHISKKFNIPISICLAQAALESGWGGSIKAMNNNAYFGIKGGRGNNFKIYSCIFDSFFHYGELINTSRYQSKIKEKGATSKKEFEKYATAIAEAGYAAGSPTYAQKLINIINTHNLSRFD
jgi:flagellum-specific peptidoglycan hydrolase FlgJ